MKTKWESRKTREESRKHSQFGISDKWACSESKNDLRLEISSCDSRADGRPCHQWRRDRKRNGWYFHPYIHFLKKTPTLGPQDNNKICYFPPLSAEREEWPCENRPPEGEDLTLWDLHGHFLSQKHPCWPDPAPGEGADNNPSWPEQGQTGQHASSLESAADLMYSCPAGEGCLSAGPRWLHLHYSERAPSGAAGNMAYSTSCRLPACGEFVWACLVAH